MDLDEWEQRLELDTSEVSAEGQELAYENPNKGGTQLRSPARVRRNVPYASSQYGPVDLIAVAPLSVCQPVPKSYL